ncbi:MAG: hypothetical protein K0U93_27615 [Gammaproteobacteria bacterium]|nr:hypothetical protein [Gammaproteobacteria bacterium]
MEANSIEPKEEVPASRKLGRDDAAELAAGASKLVVAKGKKVTDFKVGKAVSDEAIDAMLGPTGNLRAPTLRVGKTLLVGFNEESYEKVLLG